MNTHLAIYLAGNIQKGPESIESAMNYYQETQLIHDNPMRELVEGNPDLKRKLFRPILKLR